MHLNGRKRYIVRIVIYKKFINFYPAGETLTSRLRRISVVLWRIVNIVNHRLRSLHRMSGFMPKWTFPVLRYVLTVDNRDVSPFGTTVIFIKTIVLFVKRALSLFIRLTRLPDWQVKIFLFYVQAVSGPTNGIRFLMVRTLTLIIRFLSSMPKCEPRFPV